MAEAAVQTNVSYLQVADFKLDGGTQPRAEIDESIVSEYAEAMKAGESFPPVVAFQDGASVWLADGFHRVHAARRAAMKGNITGDNGKPNGKSRIAKPKVLDYQVRRGTGLIQMRRAKDSKKSQAAA